MCKGKPGRTDLLASLSALRSLLPIATMDFVDALVKSEAGETVVYLYAGSNVVQELSGGVKNSILTALGIDQPFARSNGEDRTCFLTDCLSSTWALTDGAGAPR